MSQEVKKPVIAFIDDEERILRVMNRFFRKTHQVFCTTDPEEYIAFIRSRHVHVAVSDQRMPDKTGVELLKEVKDHSPNTIRILLTGYADVEAIIGSINDGEIFRYLTKPCDTNEMMQVINRATEIAISQQKAVPSETAPVEMEDFVFPENSKKPTVLVLDDDVNVVNNMKNELGAMFNFKWASNLEEAYHHLDEGDVNVCISDIHVNGDNIAPAIYTLKQHAKNIVVLIQTSFKDASQLIDLINKGQVYRCLPKPLRLSLTKISLERAYQHHLKLVSVPEMSQRHEVEQNDTETASFSSQVVGFLSRLKRRFS